MSEHPDLNKLGQEMADALRPVFEDIGKVFNAMMDAFGGPENVKRLAEAAAAWREEHPLVEPGQHCHCWCKVRGHDNATCTREAETVHLVHNEAYGLGLVEIPMCGPCAAAVNERTEIARSIRP